MSEAEWRPDPKDVEALARAVCERDGYTPDMLVYPCEPARLGSVGPLNNLIVANSVEPLPMWHLYVTLVGSVLYDLYQQGRLSPAADVQIPDEPELPLDESDESEPVSIDFSDLAKAAETLNTAPVSVTEEWRIRMGLL